MGKCEMFCRLLKRFPERNCKIAPIEIASMKAVKLIKAKIDFPKVNLTNPNLAEDHILISFFCNLIINNY